MANKRKRRHKRAALRRAPGIVHRAAPPGDTLTTRAFAVRESTLDEATRSIEGVLATEQIAQVYDFERWEIIDEVLLISGHSIPANGQVPLLDTHDRSTVRNHYGSIRGIHAEIAELIGRLYFSQIKDADDAWTLVRENHLTDVSVSYQVLAAVMIEPGTTATVNGREYTASEARALRVTTEWLLRETSLCSIGADGAAQLRRDAATRKGPTMNFNDYLRSLGHDPETLTPAQREPLRRQWEASRAAAGTPPAATPPVAATQPATPAATPLAVEPAADRTVEPAATDPPAPQPAATTAALDAAAQRAVAEANRAEADRQAGIRELAELSGAADMAAAEITAGHTIDQARAAFLTHVRAGRPSVSAPPTPAIHVPAAATRETIEAGVMIRANALSDDGMVEQFGEQVANTAIRHRDLCLLDVARMSLQLDGVEIPVTRDATIRAAFSGYSLPTILGNAATKSLMAGYTVAPGTWRKWCSTLRTTDFKTAKAIEATDVGELKLVGEDGEVKHGSMRERSEDYSVDTYAKQFGVNRQDVINDDLGVFTTVPQRHGRKAGQRITKAVYAHLLANGNMADSNALFSTAHGNETPSKALSADNVGAIIKKLWLQKDADGESVDIQPAFLLVPATLGEVAKGICESPMLIAIGVGSSASKGAAKNPWAGILEPIIEPRLENSIYTGYDDGGWYVMASPTDSPNIGVAFLNGVETPTLERFNPTVDYLGIQFRVVLDFGVKALDWRGMQHAKDGA